MPQTLMRSEIWELSDQDPWHPVITAYASAIAVMQTLPAKDTTSWAYQAAVHAVPPGQRGDAYRDQCQHQSWYFLPWHRMYLYFFERIVRKKLAGLASVTADIKQTWALPYWNYGLGGKHATLPPAFRQQRTPDGKPNPLYVAMRSSQINAGYALPSEVVSADQALADVHFSVAATPGQTAGFGGPVTGWHHDPTTEGSFGDLEMTPHNDVHTHVGGARGFMSSFDTAPLDPVFWLHHANIDRLWAAWLREQNPPRANPAQPNWLNETFKFHDENGKSVTSAPGKVLDTVKDLHYSYSEPPGPGPAVPPAARGRIEEAPVRELAMASQPDSEGVPVAEDAVRTPEHIPELVGASAKPLTLAGESTSVSFDTAQPQSPRFQGTELLAALPEEHRMYLDVEGISGNENPGISYGVYVNAPATPAEGAPMEAHHVGNLSFFGLERVDDLDTEHSGAPGLRHAFDITDLVSSLNAAGVWNPDRVTVTFEPLRLVAPEGTAEVPAEPIAPVKIGRIGIYVE